MSRIINKKKKEITAIVLFSLIRTDRFPITMFFGYFFLFLFDHGRERKKENNPRK